MNLESLETEKFLWNLWIKGGPYGEEKYKTKSDMARTLGVSVYTLSNILKGHEDRDELNILSMDNPPSWKSLIETSGLRDQPEIHKQVLELHQHLTIL